MGFLLHPLHNGSKGSISSFWGSGWGKPTDTLNAKTGIPTQGPLGNVWDKTGLCHH